MQLALLRPPSLWRAALPLSRSAPRLSLCWSSSWLAHKDYPYIGVSALKHHLEVARIDEPSYNLDAANPFSCAAPILQRKFVELVNLVRTKVDRELLSDFPVGMVLR